MSGYHRLPPTILRSMCGGGDRAERDLLRAGQVSKRLAQLRAILDAAEHDAPAAGRAAGMRESFDALAAVQRAAPDTVADLLGGPQVGAWAAWCLRRLGRDGPGRTPLWVHLAHLGSIAVAAATRAEVPVEARVPVRAGVVSVPSVGRASTAVDDRWAPADCAVTPAGIVVDGTRPTGWEPVRALRVEAGGVALCAQVDEIDLYWRSFGIPVSARLGDAEIARWRRQLERAWAVLAERHPHRLDTMAAAIRCLVPVERGGRLGRVSASSAEAAGAVALTEPTDPTRLAATLVHESQHFRLGALHDLRPLYREPCRALLYSPWRNDPRPLPGVVHGAMAFLGVADFWLRERAGPVTELEYARHLRQLRLALPVAARAPELTELGAAVVAALRAAVERLPGDVGAPRVRRVADDLVAEHRASWRLRNVVPAEHSLCAATRAWRRGEDPLAGAVDHLEETVRAEPSGDNPLTRLAMAVVENEADVRALAADPPAFAARFPGSAASDLHLLVGDYTAARAVALDRIAAGTASHHDWAALVVAHGRRCADPDASPLVARPELVRAAWRRVTTGNDPAPLVELMAGYEAGTSTSDSMRR